MGFRCGIVGLPNVGKSTLFNALTETAAAQAANYPFCTIEPNVGNVAVPDDAAEHAGDARAVGEGGGDAAGLRRHRRAGPRRVQGRGAGQPVPRHHPRGRRGRACPALLRGGRRHPCRGQGRSDRRCGDRRDRADAGRSRLAGAARAGADQEGAGGRQGSQGRRRRAGPRAGPAARGQARAAGAGGGRGGGAAARPGAAADRQAGAVRLQRRRGRCSRGQRACRRGCSRKRQRRARRR